MTSGSILDSLFPALKRLDQLIAQAVTAVQAGRGPCRDPFRGLHIGPDDVVRWLLLDRESGASSSIPRSKSRRIPISKTLRSLCLCGCITGVRDDYGG